MVKIMQMKESITVDKTFTDYNHSLITKHGNCSFYKRFREYFRFPCVHAATEIQEISNIGADREPLLQGYNVISELDIQKRIANETGKERVRNIFKKDHVSNENSPEMELISTVTLQAGVILFAVAAVVGAKQAKINYVENNRTAVYKTPFIAHRRMNDSALRGAIKNGLNYGVKGTLVTGTIMLVSQSIAAYRNKSSPFEYSAAGALTVGMWRSYLGLRGIIGGIAIGGGMGFLAGLAIYGVMKITGETQEQRHYWHIHRQMELLRETKRELEE